MLVKCVLLYLPNGLRMANRRGYTPHDIMIC